MEKTKKFGLITSGLLFLYMLACIPNSIKLNKKINPVKQKFKTEAQTGYKIVYDPELERKILDYGGKIKEIINQRNEILSRNYGLPFPWTISGDYSNGPLEPSVMPILPAFCYHPLHKIN